MNRMKVQGPVTAAWVCEKFRQFRDEKWGEDAAEFVKPKYFKGRILTVEVDGSVWAQEVWLKRREIIDFINKEVKKKVVMDLRTAVR